MVRKTAMPSAANWSQVVYFRVYKGDVNQQHSHAYLFANGRQQCKIVVKYVLADAKGNPVVPTPGSVELLLVDGNNSYLRPGPWTISPTRNEYTWDESMFPKALAPPTDEDAGSSADDARRDHLWGTEMEITQTFYTATSVVDSTTVGARISMIGGQYSAHTLSEGIKDDNGGEGDRAGKFYSTVTVHPTKPKMFNLACYGDFVSGDTHLLKDYLLYGRVGAGNRSYEQVLMVNYDNGTRPVNLKRVVTASGNDIFSLWADRGESGNGTEWSFTYVVQPGTYSALAEDSGRIYLAAWNWSYKNTLGSRMSTLVPRVEKGSSRHVVIGHVMGGDHEQFYRMNDDGTYARLEDRRELVIIIIDEYGNDHRLRLYMKNGNDLNYLYLDLA